MCSERHPAVSIVVPAYNAQEYLPATIESIRCQSMTDFEVLLVDDGSTDSTPGICDRAAAADSRFKAIHSVNRGVAAARNLGVAHCTGKFIAFVDADDLLLTDALMTLHRLAETTGADIVAGGYIEGSEPPVSIDMDRREGSRNGDSNVAGCHPKTLSLAGVEALESGLLRREVYLSLWAKIFRSQLLKSQRFTEGIWYEDLDMLARIMPRANLYVETSEPVYFYRRHRRSIMRHWSEGLKDALDVTDRLLVTLSPLSPSMRRAAADRRYSAHYFILGLMYRNGVSDPATVDRCMSVIKEHRREVLYNSRSRVRTRIGALVSYGGRPLIKLLSKIVYR